jgi:hypothetical protein
VIRYDSAEDHRVGARSVLALFFDKGRRMTLVSASKHEGVMVLELSHPPANT